MTTLIIVILVVLLIAAFFAALFLFDLPFFGGGLGGGSKSPQGQMRNIVAAQRTAASRFDAKERKKLQELAAQSAVDRPSTSRLTLEKRFRYGRWKMAPLIFYGFQAAISIFVWTIVSTKFDILLQIVSLLSGPLFMNFLLNRSIRKRFKNFDQDYAPYLLSLVGLLKTGMNTMNAMEVAADALEDGSLVKEEVLLMMERIRLGVSEEKSIGSFAEDINHPEIELFVQALLLSKRVGGTLSDTLERLAKQVRKRQYFRESATAAVGMQRGSIWFIIVILCCLEMYLLVVYPESVKTAIADDVGWMVWQGAITVILIGIYWIRQVTKIKT